MFREVSKIFIFALCVILGIEVVVLGKEMYELFDKSYYVGIMVGLIISLIVDFYVNKTLV